MKRSKTARALCWASVLGAAALTVLRAVILKTSFDENGLLPVGSLAQPLTVLAAACCFAVLCILTLRLNRLPGTEACFSRSPVSLFLRLAAAILVFFGALTTILGGSETTVQRIAAFSGLAAALAMLWTALSPDRSSSLFWLRLVTALYAAAALILRFRDWSHDPQIIHVVPLLLPWTCCMVETMLLTGFPLNAGHRRSGVLFGLAAAVFACMLLPDCLFGLRKDLPELLTLLGLVLWGAEAAGSLLRRDVQDEEAIEKEEVIGKN